jgi:hypothetical protein
MNKGAVALILMIALAAAASAQIASCDDLLDSMYVADLSLSDRTVSYADLWNALNASERKLVAVTMKDSFPFLMFMFANVADSSPGNIPQDFFNSLGGILTSKYVDLESTTSFISDFYKDQENSTAVFLAAYVGYLLDILKKHPELDN